MLPTFMLTSTLCGIHLRPGKYGKLFSLSCGKELETVRIRRGLHATPIDMQSSIGQEGIHAGFYKDEILCTKYITVPI